MMMSFFFSIYLVLVLHFMDGQVKVSSISGTGFRVCKLSVQWLLFQIGVAMFTTVEADSRFS